MIAQQDCLRNTEITLGNSQSQIKPAENNGHCHAKAGEADSMERTGRLNTLLMDILSHYETKNYQLEYYTASRSMYDSQTHSQPLGVSPAIKQALQNGLLEATKGMIRPIFLFTECFTLKSAHSRTGEK